MSTETVSESKASTELVRWVESQYEKIILVTILYDFFSICWSSTYDPGMRLFIAIFVAAAHILLYPVHS